MASVEGSGGERRAGNPFPSLAVASIWDAQPEVLTIETAAVREVRRFADRYLRAARPGNGGYRTGELLAGTGKVCVIEGDYGTGKTHLAGELLSRVEAARAGGGPDTRTFYRVASGGSFLTLYAGLMEHDITQGEVIARVREMYADIVAEALRDRPYTEEMVARLERDDADPQLVIDRYGLKEGALREELRRRLGAVTRDETFSRALMLMLQPELQPLAWDWLVGAPPGAVLAERGVAKPIQTDVRALEALGVVARLYGERNRRFVLVIDEVERLAARWDGAATATAEAFRKLIEVFHAAGALLVVCGLPDVFDMLPDRSRFDAVVRPSSLTVGDVQWYIEKAKERTLGKRELAPFSRESVDYIVHLTRGLARDVMRICYYAYEDATETGREITPARIRMVARYRIPNNDVERVRDDIEELLVEQGWPADRHRALGGAPEAVADFWIPLGDEGNGCAVLVSDSVLEDEQARRIEDQVAALRSAGSDQVILVIGGYLAGGQQPSLSDSLSEGSLIVYHARTFGREFVTAVGAARDQIVGVTPGAWRDRPASEEFRLLREELNRLVRQQASTLHTMQELAVQTEDRLDALQRSVAAIQSVPGRTGGPRQELSGELAVLFGRARQSLDGYGDLRRFVDGTIEAAAQQPGERFARTHQLREGDTFTRIGISAFLSDLLDGFMDSVHAWLGSISQQRGRVAGATADERMRLRGICQTYDALYNVTPVYRLDQLPGAAEQQVSDQVAVPSRSARREALRQAFDGLGDRVYQAAVDAVGGAPETGSGLPP